MQQPFDYTQVRTAIDHLIAAIHRDDRQSATYHQAYDTLYTAFGFQGAEAIEDGIRAHLRDTQPCDRQ